MVTSSIGIEDFSVFYIFIKIFFFRYFDIRSALYNIPENIIKKVHFCKSGKSGLERIWLFGYSIYNAALHFTSYTPRWHESQPALYIHSL